MSPALTPTATTTTVTTTIALTPQLKRKVLVELKTFAELSQQMQALKSAMQQRKDRVQALFEEAGEFGALTQGISLDGYKAKYVTTIRTSLDKKALIDLGVTDEMLAEATVSKASRPYLKITAPGEREEDE